MSDSINEQRCEHGKTGPHFIEGSYPPMPCRFNPGPSVVTPPAQDEQRQIRTGREQLSVNLGNSHVPAAPSVSTDIDKLRQALKDDLDLQRRSGIRLLRGDMNHLVQPIIGTLRLVEADPARWDGHFIKWLPHYIERLRLALALMDEAVTGEHADVSLRRAHGVGDNHYPDLADPEASCG